MPSCLDSFSIRQCQQHRVSRIRTECVWCEYPWPSSKNPNNNNPSQSGSDRESGAKGSISSMWPGPIFLQIPKNQIPFYYFKYVLILQRILHLSLISDIRSLISTQGFDTTISILWMVQAVSDKRLVIIRCKYVWYAGEGERKHADGILLSHWF